MNLIYSCIFFNEEYIELLDLLLKSFAILEIAMKIQNILLFVILSLKLKYINISTKN